MAEEKQDTKLSQEQPQILSNPSRSSGHSTGLAGAPKTSWPELVGLTAEEAEKKVKEDFPRAEIQVVPPNHFVTMDYRTSRVRIHVDSSGKVESPPRTG